MLHSSGFVRTTVRAWGQAACKSLPTPSVNSSITCKREKTEARIKARRRSTITVGRLGVPPNAAGEPQRGPGGERQEPHRSTSVWGSRAPKSPRKAWRTTTVTAKPAARTGGVGRRILLRTSGRQALQTRPTKLESGRPVHVAPSHFHDTWLGTCSFSPPTNSSGRPHKLESRSQKSKYLAHLLYTQRPV